MYIVDLPMWFLSSLKILI